MIIIFPSAGSAALFFEHQLHSSLRTRAFSAYSNDWTKPHFLATEAGMVWLLSTISECGHLSKITRLKNPDQREPLARRLGYIGRQKSLKLPRHAANCGSGWCLLP
ncbi:hypothetical protein NKH53_27525 [Mesorhizobium australicum]|uniref:hypothetical protein n=1 Tax=Mesorhizobium australicum TaxID=536018 RepID=UPI003334E307